MNIQGTVAGGRRVSGFTPWGDYRVEWDADGNLISHSITIKTPQPNLAPGLPTDPAEAARIREAERRESTTGGGCGCSEPTRTTAEELRDAESDEIR